METAKQAYWHTDYRFFKNYVKDSKAHQSYKRFCKRQFHKVRRQYDKEIIEERLDILAYKQHLLNEIFSTDVNRYEYAQVA